ncbi:MAG: ABC transporter substrate-binding protein [Thermoguttaceae bacterium]
MRGPAALLASVGVVFLACFWAKGEWVPSAPALASRDAVPQRIITMAPSVTETVFALGLGDRVVGVSDYCNYPPEALAKPKIGGLLNPNFERIVGLHPDAVLLLESSVQDPSVFGKLQIPFLEVDHLGIDGVVASIRQIGAACGAESRAQAILDDIGRRLDRISEKTAGRRPPRVMVAIDRTLGAGSLQDVYIAGRDGHIDRILELAGGRNAWTGGRVRFPVVSQEGILQIDPEVIVDLACALAGKNADAAVLRGDWQCLAEVDAVRNGRVYLVADAYATIPGPRFILFVEKLARLLHPDVDWEG